MAEETAKLVKETVEQIRDAQIIRDLALVCRELERGNTHPSLIQTMIDLQRALIEEWNAKYAPQTDKEKDVT